MTPPSSNPDLQLVGLSRAAGQLGRQRGGYSRQRAQEIGLGKLVDPRDVCHQ